MRKSFGVLLLVGAFLLSFAPKANATLLLAGDVNGVTFCAVDNNAFACTATNVLSDTNIATGNLSLANGTSINGLEVNGSIQTATVGPPTNILNASSLSIINTSGATRTAHVTVSATDFVGPVIEASTAGAGTWELATNSTASLTWYNDPGNDQGGQTSGDRPGVLLTTFNDTATAAADAFSTSGVFAVSDPSLFSMTLGLDVTLVAGGRLINSGRTEIKDVSVPDGGTTMSFLGLSLLGVAAVRRKFLV